MIRRDELCREILAAIGAPRSSLPLDAVARLATEFTKAELVLIAQYFRNVQQLHSDAEVACPSHAIVSSFNAEMRRAGALRLDLERRVRTKAQARRTRSGHARRSPPTGSSSDAS